MCKITESVKKCKIENRKSVTKNVHVTKYNENDTKMTLNVTFLVCKLVCKITESAKLKIENRKTVTKNVYMTKCNETK